MNLTIRLLLVSTLFSSAAFATTAAAPAAKPAAGAGDSGTKLPPAVEKIPTNAKVFFVNLKEGQVIGTSYKVEFGLQGMKIQPAGALVPGTGHHHLIINGQGLPRGQVIPADEKHVHFGKGQTDFELKLPVGKHKLTLQFADGAHLSYGPQMASTVAIEVK